MRRRPVSRWILIAVMVTLALATLAPSEPTRADVVELGSLTGTWVYADGRRGMRQIDAAVERAIRGMSFFVAPIAREVVRGRTVHFREIRMGVDGELVRFATESWGPVATTLGAPPIPVTAPEGTHIDLSQRADRGRLIQLFAHREGARENTFALSGDRQWMWMSVRIFSPQLPHECRYRLRYRRSDRSEPFARR